MSELSPDTAPRADQGDLEAPAPAGAGRAAHQGRVEAGPGHRRRLRRARAGHRHLRRLADRLARATRLRRRGRPGDPHHDRGPVLGGPVGQRVADGRRAAGAPEPLAILKVEAYDPEGDGEENNNLTPKIYDGDKGTGWFSENYRTDSFGGLKKGVGVIVDLGPNKKPQTVELDIPHPSDVEVYVGPDNRLEGATKIGEKADADGKVTFDVPADVSGQYIVVWFTKLNADDNGKRRAWLDEVVVTG